LKDIDRVNGRIVDSQSGGTPVLVSVVAPVFNESASLPEFVRRLSDVCRQLGSRYEWEFILVDDGSTDSSLDVCRQLISTEPRLRVIELRRNFGQTAALQAGLAAAAGGVIVSMDADLQHFPEDIPQFLAHIEEGSDLVCGWRHNRQEDVLRRWPSRMANWMIKRVAGVDIHDFGTTFRAYRSDLVQHISLLGEQHRFVPALATQVGARVVEVPIENVARPHGTSNYGLGRTLGVFLDIVFLYFSTRYFTRPLKAFGKIALVLWAAGTAIAGSLVTYSWITGIPTVRERGGWFLLAAVMWLASLQILLTGLLAEILVRVYYRASGTRSYVIRREWNSRSARSAERI
jgi:glycosyltransferase involved in cell wall biosynthesis